MKKESKKQVKLHLSSLKKGRKKEKKIVVDEHAKIRETRNQSNKNPKSLEDTMPKLKKQRQKKLITRLIALILLFSFAILVVVYFISPLSKVDMLSVSGTKEVADQEIIDVSQIKSGDNLWKVFFERKEISKNLLSELPQVKSMKISFDGLNDYIIKIEEYQTVAYLAEENKYYNILENGKIVNESRKVSIGNPPIFKSFEENKALKAMIEQYKLLNENIQNSISEVEYTPSEIDDYLIKLYMNDGNEVVASIPSFAEKMIYYPDMVKKIGDQKGTFNIEVGAYFSPFEFNNEKKEEPKTISDENSVKLDLDAEIQ
ncbi:divIB [Carnobacterium sp. AT7]|uniref:cell division protein FtsQ/DivIB n=1 Tax=Carnobacterium TaxID=2747 RepID=UPI00015F1A60|nr:MULTISPECIES: cell division protein FtsQ/DivIB [Carnobacterium]EDP68214.1 divIB [Carnobacterium sp. AT7]